MLGGFNSVKRENHHYKYAFCTNNDDIKRIYSAYKKDLTVDNAWTYSLTSLVTGKDAFKNATISRFEGDLSNLKTVEGVRLQVVTVIFGFLLGPKQHQKFTNVFSMTPKVTKYLT